MPTTDLPEVNDYLETEAELRGFIERHQSFYDELAALTRARKDKLELAEKAARVANKTVGPFIRLSETQKINAEKLFEEMGEAAFKEVGGYTETVTDYKVDRNRFLSISTRGDIPQEILEVCVKTEVRFKKPPTYVLP